jgi:hypothetical protein
MYKNINKKVVLYPRLSRISLGNTGMFMTHNKHTIGPISDIEVARIVQMRTRHMKPVLTKLNITLDSNSGISSGRLIRINERVAIRASIGLLALGGN